MLRQGGCLGVDTGRQERQRGTRLLGERCYENARVLLVVSEWWWCVFV